MWRSAPDPDGWGTTHSGIWLPASRATPRRPVGRGDWLLHRSCRSVRGGRRATCRLLPDHHVRDGLDAIARTVSGSGADAVRAGEEPSVPDAEIDVRAEVGPGHERALLRTVRE